MPNTKVRPTIAGDIKRLWKHAATIGFVVAIVCHSLPPHYRGICDSLKQLCELGGK